MLLVVVCRILEDCTQTICGTGNEMLKNVEIEKIFIHLVEGQKANMVVSTICF